MKKAYLAPDVILKMIIDKDVELITTMCKQEKVKVVTSAFAIWETLGCLTKEELADISILYDILHKIPIVDFEHEMIPTITRIKQLRTIAGGKTKC